MSNYGDMDNANTGYANNNNNGYSNTGGYNKKATFDLSKYETVKQRKTRLRADHPESIIYPMQVSGMGYANHFVVFLALIWKNKESRVKDPIVLEQVARLAQGVNSDNAGIIAGTIGLMLNADSIGYSLSMAGGSMADKNAWVENCEESASGRALDNLGYHSGSASQEEMIKVQHTEQVIQERTQLENQITHLLNILQVRGTQFLEQLHQQCIASTKPFTYLTELAPDQLQTVFSILDQAGRQSA